MKIYAKLKNGNLEYAGNTLVIGGREITAETFTDAQYLQAGFKELIKADIQPPLEWFQDAVLNYTENDTQIIEGWDVTHKQNIKAIYLENCLIELNRSLENDFSWPLENGRVVKLSKENQSDYASCESRLILNPELLPYVHYTFKDKSIKYYMSSIDEVKDFSKAAFLFIAQQLSIYRENEVWLEFLTDEELYNYLILPK